MKVEMQKGGGRRAGILKIQKEKEGRNKNDKCKKKELQSYWQCCYVCQTDMHTQKIRIVTQVIFRLTRDRFSTIW